MGIRESLLNTITSVADSDFVRIVTSAGASSKATVRDLFKGFESNLGAKSSLTTSDYVRVVGSDNEAYKQTLSAVMAAMGLDVLDAIKNPATSISNIDEATATGFYAYGSGASGTKPTASGGDLIVIAHNDAYSVQIAITYSATATNYIYRRVINSGVPTEWKLHPTRAEIDALNTVQAVTFTPNSGFTSNIFIRKVGKVVIVNGYITATNAFGSSETIVGNIPEGSRPGSTIRAAAGISSAAYSPGDVAYVAIGTGGNLGITAKSGNTYKNAYFSISYAAQN